MKIEAKEEEQEGELTGCNQIEIKALPIDRTFNTSICFIYVYY